MRRIVKKNKKAWVKMVEVFISIMLLTSAVVLFISKNSFSANHEKETDQTIKHILLNIQRNDELREEVLDAGGLPVEWENFNSSGLTNTGLKIYEKTPPNLVCQGMVCPLNYDCLNSGAPEDKDIYSRTAYISSDLDTYSPRELKVFCWRK